MNMVLRSFLILAFMLGCSAVTAQERTATITLTGDAPMTWQTLGSQVAAMKTQADDLTTRIDRLTKCGKKGLIYAPSGPHADGDGCSATNNSYNTAPDLSALNNKIMSIIGCYEGQKYFNGSSCVAAVVTAPADNRWVAAGTGLATLPNCPAGVGNICSPQGAVCKTTTVGSRRCSDNQCSGMGYTPTYQYNRFVCN